ncbi:choice-of-anchor M domain-containing protein [Trueperella bonasi]|uniref:choice-of-anchor M domain-containing protein n=1 Tax=Trueperella bonasi TaxID=312286 RepID=UPI0027D7CAF6|nr:choice-of-anchor M domain-containing protein [Trueperella bonasi]
MGGQRPSAEGIGGVKVAFDAAKAEDAASFTPSFSVAPFTGGERDGDANLSTLKFATGKLADQGTAVFYIDGYYLTEVPVDYRSAVEVTAPNTAEVSEAAQFVASEQPTTPEQPGTPEQAAVPTQPAKPEEPGSPGAKETPDAPEILDEAVVIDRGRVHISPVQSGDDVVMVIGDDSCQHTQKSVLRKPEAVTFKVGESAKKIRGLISAEEAREAGLGQPVFTQDSYDFLGEQGAVFWVVPLAQVEGLVWSEFSTERMPTEAFPNGVNLRVSPVSAPEGGKWWAFVSDFPNNVTLFGSSEGSQEIENTSPATFTIIGCSRSQVRT